MASLNLFSHPRYALEGVIYDASWGKTYGEVVIVTGQDGATYTIPLSKFLGLKKAILSSDIGVGLVRGTGAGLVTLGIAGAALTVRPLVTSEIGYRIHKAGNIVQEQLTDKAFEEAVAKTKAANQEKEYATRFAQEVGAPNTDFSIYIPKIDAKAPVIGNVDSTAQDVYGSALKQGVAHAYGSSTPGNKGGTYIFAHSTNGPWNVSRYNAVFYLLRELDPSTKDEIYVFYQGKVHKYTVAEKHVVDGSDTSWLVNSKEGEERLILQTCWPPGTVWKRMIVIAKPVEVDASAPLDTSTSGPVYGGVN